MSFNTIKVNNTDTGYTHSIFDISEYNSGAIYVNLSAALSAVPQNRKQGGMTVKFILTINQAQYSVVKTEGLETEPSGTLLSEEPDIDSGTYDESQLFGIFTTLPSDTGAGNALTYYVAVTVDETTTYTSWVITKVQNSDNKYVQYRLVADEWSTVVSNWQSENADDEPIAGSENLVKSSGVFQTKESGDYVQDNIGFDYSVPTQFTNYLMLVDLPIKVGDSGFYVQVETTSTSRILVIANNNNNLRVIDSASDNRFINNYVLIYPNWDITSLGLHIISPDSTYILKIKRLKISETICDNEPRQNSKKFANSGGIYNFVKNETQELKTQIDNEIPPIEQKIDETNYYLFGYNFISDFITSNNYQLFNDLIPAKTLFKVKVNAQGTLTRVIINYNNDTNKRLIDSNNSSVEAIVGNWFEFTLNVDVTYIGLWFQGTNCSVQLEVKTEEGKIQEIDNEIQGLNNEISEIQEELVGYEKSAQTTSSNTNLLTNLNIKNSGYEYYLKVQVESYTRIVVNYNGNTDLRLFDTLTDTSFINNYVKVDIGSNVTILGLYLSGVSSATLYLKCIPLGAKVTDVLVGKKWYACGDSFTKGGWSYATSQNTFQDEPYKNKFKVYPYFIGRRIPSLEVNNIAVGGMSMCAKRSDPNDDNSFTASGTPNHPTPLYQSIPVNADIITLYFGINDNNYGCPLGSMDDGAGNQSFYGAWNEVLTWLITNRPNAKIGIIITNGSAPRFTAAERELAKKYGIPYLDLELDIERVPYLIRQYERTISGGGDMDNNIATLRDQQNAIDWGTNGHPNEKCHELESTIIENWLRTL